MQVLLRSGEITVLYANPDPERERIRTALVKLVAERGYSGTKLEDVLDRAGLDRATFERHFASLDVCFAEAWNDFAQQFIERTEVSYAKGADWREGVRLQAWELCRFLQEDHDRTRFLIDLSFAEEMVQANRDIIMGRYIDFLHLGRLEREEAAGLTRARAEGLVGAIWEGVAVNVHAGNFDALPEGVPQILYLTMLAYLGPEAAQEELRRGPEDIARYERGEL